MRPLRRDAGIKHIPIDGRHDATPDDGVAALTDTRYGPGQESDASRSGRRSLQVDDGNSVEAVREATFSMCTDPGVSERCLVKFN
jgi:hypothetical protein